MHALEQRRLAAWKGHSADLKASQQQHTHTHTYAHTAVQCAPVPGAVGARCAVLEFTSDSFCWSLNTSFPFGLCLSPLSLRLLMIGTSMSSVCIFHGRLGSLPPPRIVHTDPVDSSRLHRVRRGGPWLRRAKLRISSSSSCCCCDSPPPDMFDSLSLLEPRGRS